MEEVNDEIYEERIYQEQCCRLTCSKVPRVPPSLSKVYHEPSFICKTIFRDCDYVEREVIMWVWEASLRVNSIFVTNERERERERERECVCVCVCVCVW